MMPCDHVRSGRTNELTTRLRAGGPNEVRKRMVLFNIIDQDPTSRAHEMPCERELEHHVGITVIAVMQEDVSRLQFRKGRRQQHLSRPEAKFVASPQSVWNRPARFFAGGDLAGPLVQDSRIAAGKVDRSQLALVVVFHCQQEEGRAETVQNARLDEHGRLGNASHQVQQAAVDTEVGDVLKMCALKARCSGNEPIQLCEKVLGPRQIIAIPFEIVPRNLQKLRKRRQVVLDAKGVHISFRSERRLRRACVEQGIRRTAGQLGSRPAAFSGSFRASNLRDSRRGNTEWRRSAPRKSNADDLGPHRRFARGIPRRCPEPSRSLPAR